MLAKYIELSPAKLNLFLKIVNKRDDGYHNLRSGITLINLYDEVIAEKNSHFKIKYIGKFAPQKKIFSDCIVEKIFSTFELDKPNYCFTIKKNIPIQSGLGSGSSNAAAIIRILEKLNYKNLKLNNFAKIGADVPLFIKNQDCLIRGIGDILIEKKFPKYYFILIMPAQNCSTKEMYEQINTKQLNFDTNLDTNEINEYDSGNDFELIAKKKYNEINNLFKFMQSLPNVIFTRLTGSGSCIFSAFESKKNAENCLITIRKKYPSLWTRIVENNFL